MIRIPSSTAPFDQFRIAAAASWGGADGSAQTCGTSLWKIYPVVTGNGTGGFRLNRFTRTCLPGIGECEFTHVLGRMLNVGGDTQYRGKGFLSDAYLTDAQKWDQAKSVDEVPDLHGYIVLIQGLVSTTSSGETWKTLWVGRIVRQEDEPVGAAAVPSGIRRYQGVDLFYAYASKWRMDTHQFSSAAGSGTIRSGAYGHPGYNGSGDATPGNKSVDTATIAGTAVKAHTFLGVGSTWSDREAFDNSMAAQRISGQPLFVMSGTLDGYGRANSWPVSTDEYAWDVVNRICDRKRGAGVVFLDWTEAVSSRSSIGAVSVSMKVVPIFYRDITFDLPSGSSAMIHGANSNSDAITVDIIGDKRLVPDSYSATMPEYAFYDAVIAEGEPIQIMVTLSTYDGSLEAAWTAGNETSWSALASDKKTDDVWRPIYQQFRLPRAWNGRAKDGYNGATISVGSAFWYLSDLGVLTEDVSGGTYGVTTSNCLVKILPDLPILEGHSYSTGTATLTVGQSTGSPERVPAAVYIRASGSSTDKFINATDNSYNMSLRIQNDSIWVTNSSDESDGVRTVESIGKDHVAVTVALELPFRAMCKVGSTGSRIKKLAMPGRQLWLGHAGAIWGLDNSTVASGFSTPRRQVLTAGAALPAILRDDRDTLAYAATVGYEWHGSSIGRRVAKWSLRCCGLFDSFMVDNETGVGQSDVLYPTLGKHVTTINAGGTTWQINTNITAISYDNTTGTTSWQTDFWELDFS